MSLRLPPSTEVLQHHAVRQAKYVTEGCVADDMDVLTNVTVFGSGVALSFVGPFHGPNIIRAIGPIAAVLDADGMSFTADTYMMEDTLKAQEYYADEHSPDLGSLFDAGDPSVSECIIVMTYDRRAKMFRDDKFPYRRDRDPIWSEPGAELNGENVMLGGAVPDAIRQVFDGFDEMSEPLLRALRRAGIHAGMYDANVDDIEVIVDTITVVLRDYVNALELTYAMGVNIIADDESAERWVDQLTEKLRKVGTVITDD